MTLVIEAWIPVEGLSDWADIGMVEVGRLGPLVHPPGTPERDAEVHAYEVKLDGHVVGQVEHQYGKGAWALAYHALALVVYREDTL